QRQVKLNVVNIVCATLRGVGAVLVLSLIAPTVQYFFAWQCIIGFVSVFWLRHSLWASVSRDAAFHWFNFKALTQVGRFTAGVAGINILSFLLTQIDKIILSKILPLSTFGYYTLAWTLGTFAYRFTAPIFNAYYPRITQMITQVD